MPVDPGNLLVLGHHGEVPVVGVPGCARSPKLNGFDWVLQRLCAGIPVSRRDITRMGAGGLLKEIASRPIARTSVGEGKSVSVREDLGGRRIIKQTKTYNRHGRQKENK